MYTIIFFIVVGLSLFTAGFFSKKDNQVIINGHLPRLYTDALRGLAMVMIISGHICGRYHESVWFSPFACTGVALFLLLSGYGNNESYLKKGYFSLKKVLKLAIPYWIIYAIRLIFLQEDVSFTSVLQNVLFVKTDYWFVGYIIKWYIIFWIATRFCYNYRWIVFIVFSIVSFVFFSPLESEQSLSFIFGVFLSEKKNILLTKKEKKLDFLAIVLFVFASLALLVKQAPVIRHNDLLMRCVQLMIKLPYAISILVLLRRIRLLRMNPVFLFLAPFTYELYLIHMLFLDLISTSTALYTLLSTLLVVTLSISVAWMFNRLNRVLVNRIV